MQFKFYSHYRIKSEIGGYENRRIGERYRLLNTDDPLL